MFSQGFHPASFLRAVAGTEPFLAYCASRAVPFDASGGQTALERFAEAVGSLPAARQAAVEMELAQVHELSGPEATAHLLEAAEGGTIPGDDIPSGSALALWFLVHRPELFRDVFFHHEVSEIHNWRVARADAHLPIGDPAAKAEALGEAIRDFFRQSAGTGRFSAVETRTLPDAVCFAARVADRIQLVESFADDGTPSLLRLRPALAVFFVYTRSDGSVRLKSPLRADDRVRDLFQQFGQAVLGQPVRGFGEGFDLDKLKRPFLLLPDGEDMGVPRLKTLHLRYPARLGRRTLKLETLTTDEPHAIEQLLRAHVGNVHELAVCHAEIQVPIRSGERSRSHLVRLWLDRCNLNQTPLGERLRRCLIGGACGMRSVTFLLGLLSPDAPAFVTAEDVEGPHADAIRTWQEQGFIGHEPGGHPHPSCPHCAEGIPYRAEGRLLCSACHSAVDGRELLAWPVRRDAFLAALAVHVGLRDGIRPVGGELWELGGTSVEGDAVACFFHPGGPLSPAARDQLAAYRRTLVFTAHPSPDAGRPGRWVPLGRILEVNGAFARVGLADLLRDRGAVRFDRETGALRVGTALVGEVPLGSREWALLTCLAGQIDQFVPYCDLKRAVLRETGGSGDGDEATFCQKLKSRMKKEFVPGIDRLIVTSNKGDGYRLQAEGEP